MNRGDQVVRVALSAQECTPAMRALIEGLRHGGLAELHRMNDAGACFDLLPPRDVTGRATRLWARRTSEQLNAWGLNAVAAPAWVDDAAEGS